MSFQVMISQLGSGMMTTIQIFLLTLIFSLPLGLLVALSLIHISEPTRP